LHFLTPVLTLILGPLLSATYLLGLLTFIFPFLIPVLNWLTKALFLLLDLLIKFDLKVIFGKPSKVWIILFYLLLFLTLYAVFVRHRPLKTMGLIGLILLVVPFQKKITHLGTEAIYFINVGQGDAILVRHERKTILIDTGGTRYRDLALETLIPFFYSLQITALDAVWITHDDYDHSGALASLAQHFPIGSILSDERVYDFGDLQMQNLNYQFRDQFHDENDRSAVLYFPLMGKNFLLMGDASSQVEEHLLVNYPALAVDVLKLGHHGSATSSSYAFLQSFTPELAIISVGKNNYGHPSEQVLNRLDELQIPYLRTDEVGTITLTGIGNVCYNKTSQKWL
jgi:competence protein ComEC